MELVCWDGGLHLHEIVALDLMKKVFVAKQSTSEKAPQKSKGSLSSQLGQVLMRPMDSMFPWKGYAGFRFVDSKGAEGEFDLLLVTHDRILIIELKELKGNRITYSDEKWYCDGLEKYRSPVSVTQNKVYLLKNKLEKIKHKFSSNKVPWIDFLVVLSNNNDYSTLPEHQKKHVMTIDDFLKLADETRYNKRFNVRAPNPFLNSQFAIFDGLISDGNVKPKHLSVQNYITTVDDQIFPLPGQESVYKEYLATSEANKNDKALLRQWDFDKIDDQGSSTPEGRYFIVSHERDVLVEIKNQAPDLYRYCLQPKTNPTREEVTRQFHELYDLPVDHKRFNEYISLHGESYGDAEKISLMQVLLQQFSELHLANIAHRDIGDHSIWLSPSKKISLSSFISSYYQPLGTVGPRRKKLSVGMIPLPEDGDGSAGTPFHQDVYALGIICQLILSGLRVTVDNINIALKSINESHEWYGDILRKAVCNEPSGRFKNAIEFRDAITAAKPVSAAYILHHEEQLDRYRKTLNPYKTYPDDEVLIDANGKEVYISGDLIVRLWSDVNPSVEQPQIFQACLMFFEKANRLAGLNSKYLAPIRDFGIALKTSQLFLIQQKIEGIELSKWMENVSSIDEKRHVVEQIIRGIEYLHNVEAFHGDLHPKNVIVSVEGDEKGICFIDYLDFCKSGERVKNHRYSPQDIDTASESSCDNFAVMRMSAEILGIDWDNVDSAAETYPSLVTALKKEQSGIASYLSLDRFKQALKEDFTILSNSHEITVVIRSDLDRETVNILPDNEELFIHIERASTSGEVKLHFSGIGGNINFFYSTPSNAIKGNTPFFDVDTVNAWERANSQLVINAKIKISFERYSDYSELNAFLATLDGFEEIIKSTLHELEEVDLLLGEHNSNDENNALKGNDSGNANVIDIEKESVIKRKVLSLKGISIPEIELIKKIRPKPHQIWRSMIETEVDALPTISLTTKPDYASAPGFIRLQYTTNTNFLDKFSLDDEVELLRKIDEKLYNCGKLDIKESNSKFLVITSVNSKTKFDVDDVLHLRTNSQRSSFIRRKKAVDRVLDRTSVIPDLVDYFGECGAEKAIEYSKGPSEEDFSVYDRDDGHGGMISLNELQRKAFTKLVTTGPVSLLQGPPGTGKTEFIAAFTHYLISKQGARHILLVSQSHEAVNTAAERIRQHCSMHDTALDIVRFSNKSSNISAGLVDAYSVYLVEARLEEFRAQFAERLHALRGALGLPKDYLEAILDKELGLNKRLRVLIQLTADIDSMSPNNPDRSHLINSATNIRSQIADQCSEKYHIAIDDKPASEISRLVDDSISFRFGVAPNEAKRMKLMMSLMNDYQERLDTSPGSYEEFLARSRTLVCGTCVGIGLGHLSVRENQYDWVIIDEAARSASSELAIAMQSGKRVLLVGDHKQLPPTYQDEHKTELSRLFKLNKDDPDFEWILKSDFERAFESEYGKVAGAKLLIQYRMAEPIGKMVSDIFYGSELKTGERHLPNIYNNLCDSFMATVTWLDLSPLGNSAKSQEDKNHSNFNPEEADQIIRLLKQIEENSEFVSNLSEVAGDEPAIGIICMYGAQKRLLFRKFNEQTWSEEFKGMVKIDTVDSYQGKENRIIIVSTTLNTHDKKPRFLKVLNRINVAMSRAMDKLVIVGATEMWKGKNAKYPLGEIASYIQKHQGPDYRFVSAKPTQINGGSINAKR